MGRSKTLPGEARADDLAGHSTREVPFSRWPLLIIPLEYWREEVLHQRKGCRRYSSLKRLTCSSLAHFLLCLAPPPHPHLSFDHFPLCSLCSSHIGFIHKPCRNSGTTAAPGHLHNSTLRGPFHSSTSHRQGHSMLFLNTFSQDYAIKVATRTPSTASHPASSPCSSIVFFALIIFYYMCIRTEGPRGLQSMGHKELDTTE